MLRYYINPEGNFCAIDMLNAIEMQGGERQKYIYLHSGAINVDVRVLSRTTLLSVTG